MHAITSQILRRALKEGGGGSYSHFPAQILTKSHRPTAQIPSWLCLSCSNLNPIPIFYCFFVDESQSQCMKSHFPSQKMGKSQFPFYPFRTLFKDNILLLISTSYAFKCSETRSKLTLSLLHSNWFVN